MVKVQKPNPKTLINNPKKVDKPNGIKKEKAAKDVNVIPASKVEAKKAKTSLIEKKIQKNEFKPEQKVKKAPTLEPVVQLKKPKVKEANKKKELAKEPMENLEKVKKPPTLKRRRSEHTHVVNKYAAVMLGNARPTKKQSYPLSQQREHKFRRLERFNVGRYNDAVNTENIKKIAQDLKATVEKDQKEDMPSKFRYFLNVSLYAKLICTSLTVKLNLKHSIVDINEDNGVVIVKDKPTNPNDVEPIELHYEGLFREAGLTRLKVVPFSQIQNECTTPEAMDNFCNSYDFILCDRLIISHVIGFCRQYFDKGHKAFYAVNLNDPTMYKTVIETVLRCTSFKQVGNFCYITVPVGSSRQTFDQLADNIQLVLHQLKTHSASGLPNIRNLNLRTSIKGTAPVPLYSRVSGAPAEANYGLAKFILKKSEEFFTFNETERKCKRQIQEACNTLLSSSSTSKDEEVPAKKSKNDVKQKKVESEPKCEEEEVADGDNDSDDDESDGNDENDSDDDKNDGSDNDEDDDSNNDEDDDNDDEGDNNDEDGSDDDDDDDDNDDVESDSD